MFCIVKGAREKKSLKSTALYTIARFSTGTFFTTVFLTAYRWIGSPKYAESLVPCS